MDIFEIVKELKELLDKFPKIKVSEVEQLRVLSNNLSVECDGYLYDLEYMTNRKEE